MNMIFRYTVLNIKKALKLSKFSFISAVIILIVATLVSYIAISLDNSNEDNQKIKVGIVGDPKDSYIGLGISALDRLDSSRYSINFVKLSEKEARQKLQKAQIAGYIIISDEFLEALGRGEHEKLKFVSRYNLGLADNILKEAAQVLSVALFNSERAIYAMQDFVIDKKEPKLSEITVDMNKVFINKIFTRNNLYDIEVMDYYKEIDIKSYYISSMFAFFIILSGIGLSLLLIKKDMELYKILQSKGFSFIYQVISEFTVAFVYMCISLLLPFIILIALYNFDYMDIEPVSLLMASLPLVMVLTAIYQLIYELISDFIAAISTSFVLMLSMAYLSGVFYPASFFADEIKLFIKFLPINSGLEIMQGVFLSQPAQAFYYDMSDSFNYTNNVINSTRNYLLSSEVISHIKKGDYSSKKKSNSKKTTTKTTGSSATSTTAPKPAKKAKITFKSDGNTRGLDYFVNNYPSKQRGEARTYLKQMQDSFPQVARSVGIPTNDLSSGLAAAIAGAYMAYNNVSLNDDYMKPMQNQLKTVLQGVDDFDKMSNSDKKYIYDQLVIIGMSLAVNQSQNQQNPNAKVTAQLRNAGKQVLEGLLGVNASEVKITSSGLSY